MQSFRASPCRPLIRVLDAAGDQHTARATHAKALAVGEFINVRPVAVNAAIQVDPSLVGFFAKIGTGGDLDFFVFFGEFDDWHRSDLLSKGVEIESDE